MKALVTVDELQQMLLAGSVSLIYVLLPEDFACRHIAGAQNACVYEMVFMDRIAETVPERGKAVVVYDDSGSTLAACTAKEKLERAGYSNVAILEGGYQAWLNSGYEVVVTESASLPPSINNGIYKVDVEKSVLEWTGRNINNRHYGRIAISGGDVVMVGGRPASGRFVLDMKKITDLDLEDDGWRGMLLRHLKSEDFFDVERYPTAVFELRGAAVLAKCTPGTPNMEIAGSLLIKETSHSLCFQAIVAAQDDGSIKAQAALNLDRTLWNVNYGSGKLYERLGMHLVNDQIGVDLFIVAREAG